MAALGRVEGVGQVCSGLVNDGDDDMNGLTSSKYAENRLVVAPSPRPKDRGREPESGPQPQ